MKTMPPANWLSIGVSFPWFRQKATGSLPGSTTKEQYKRRNEVERLFRRLKSLRRTFSHFEKLDMMFIGFRLCAYHQCITIVLTHPN